MLIGSRERKLIISFVSGLLFILIVWGVAPPRHFPVGEIVTIPEGTGLYAVGQILEKGEVIRSPFWFRTVSILLGGERRLQAGQYYLSKPEPVTLMAWRILHGHYDIETVKMTIPEGFTVEEISKLFDVKCFYENRFLECERS